MAGQHRSWRGRSRVVAVVAIVAAAAVALPGAAVAAGGAVGPSGSVADFPFVDPAAHTGLTSDTAAGSCWEIKQLHPDAVSGAYWLLTPSMTAPATFWCDQETDGGGWVKVGHGRQNWETNAVGRGAASSLLTAAPLASAVTTQLSAKTVDGLLDGDPVTALADGIRLRRAADTAGTTWQEVRFKPTKLAGWAWSMGGGHLLTSWTVGTTSGTGGTSSSFGSGTSTSWVDTSIGTDHQFTWGFSYGNGVTGLSAATSYLWTPTDGQGSARPFTEVYLRPQILSGELTFPEVPDAGTSAIEQESVPDSLARRSTWGVAGIAGSASVEGDVEVQAFAQIGNVMYVGGNFRYVQRDAAGTGRVEQNFLAAFNATTGDYIPAFAPVLNEAVRSLAALPDGRLAVGGKFTQVNGASRAGLVVLNASTGASSASWNTAIVNGVSPGLVQVRSLEVAGSWLYVSGLFTHTTGPTGGQVYARNAVRVNASTGAPDNTWRPEFNGSVQDSDISEDGARAYYAGFFTMMGTATATSAASLVTSSPVGLDPVPWNPVWSNTSKFYQRAIEQTGERVFVGGSEHLMFSFDTSSYERLSTHIANPKGDFQALTAGGGFLYGGSHSNWYLYEGATDWPSVGTAWTAVDTIGWFNAWDSDNAKYVSTFSPTMSSRLGSGIWAIEVATDGTVWAGGDIQSGRVTGNVAGFLGGFARFGRVDSTAPSTPPSLRIASQDAATVRLAWNAPSGGIGTGGSYQVIRDNRVIATTTALALTVPKGGANRFFVRAADAAGNVSASSPVLVVPGGNPAPVARIDYEVDQLDVVFDASSSTDDQSIVAYYWNLGDGTTTTEPIVSHRYAGGGHYPVSLVVVDDEGAWTRTEVLLDLEQPTPTDAYGAAVFGDGPSQYWRLDESSGTVAFDSAIGTSLGAYQGGVLLGAADALVDVAGTAVTLDGSNDQVVATGLQTGPSTYTVEAWFSTTTTRGGKIIGFGNAATGLSSNYDRHVYMQNDGTLVFGAYTGAEVRVTTPGAYNDGRWHHVVATQSGAGMVLYVDGVSTGSNPNTIAQAYSGYWRVGGDRTWSSSSTHLAGKIDEAAVYPTALSATQAAEHYALGLGQGFPTPAPTDEYGQTVGADSPLAYWRLDGSSEGIIGDASGSYVAGQIRGGVTNGAPGVSGSTMSGIFNGVDGAVSERYSRAAPGAFAVELWFSTTSSQGGKLVGFGNAATGLSSNYDRHVYLRDDGRLTFGVYTGAEVRVESSQAYNDGQWHHLVAQQGPGGMELYVDGLLVGSAPTTTAQSYRGYWRIGGDRVWSGATNAYLTGSIDEVALYPEPLSASRVMAHYGAGTAAVNQQPTAIFVPTVTDLTVELTSTSYDPDGTIVGYAWTFGDGATATGATTSHGYAAGGTFTIGLTVTDDRGGTATTSHDVSVAPAPNQAPTAAFTPTVSGLGVAVDGVGSYDPDGTIGSFAWALGDGATATGVTASHTYAAAGSYTVSLTVTDNRGATDVISQQVTVSDPSAPVESVPVAMGATWSWRYAAGAPPVGWNQLGFDASAWASGPATLGFGSTAIATNIDISGPTTDRPRAAYFVGDFEVADASSVVSLTLDSVADDGVVIYVNGTEVGRHNMRDGEVTYLTYAPSARRTTVANADPVVIEVPISLLVNGTNRIAAETHLNYRATADISFRLEATMLAR